LTSFRYKFHISFSELFWAIAGVNMVTQYPPFPNSTHHHHCGLDRGRGDSRGN
jgi:hypothetical protein